MGLPYPFGIARLRGSTVVVGHRYGLARRYLFSTCAPCRHPTWACGARGWSVEPMDHFSFGPVVSLVQMPRSQLLIVPVGPYVYYRTMSPSFPYGVGVEGMDSKRTVSLVIEHEGSKPRIAVEYPLSPMQLRLIERAARQGMACVPDVLRSEVLDAVEHLDKAASSLGA